MLNKLKKNLTKLIDFGVNHSFSSEKIENIRLSNKLTLILSGVAFPYIGIFYLMNLFLLSYMAILVVSGYLAVIYFNALKKHKFAKHILVVNTMWTIYFYSCMLGKESGIQMVYYASIILPIVLFGGTNKKETVWATLFIGGCFVLLEQVGYKRVTPYSISSVNIRLIYYTATFATFCISLVSVSFFHSLNEQSKDKLKLLNLNLFNKNKALQKANKTIEKNTKQETYLTMARDIQNQFIPTIPKEITFHGNYHFETIYKPSNQLSGDLYDFQISGNRVKVFHGDVAGKNVPAMMVALSIRAELKYLFNVARPPHQLMARLNEEMRKIRSKISACAGIYYELNLKTQQVTYVQMGFDHIYVIRDQEVIDLGKEGGFQLGYIESIHYEQRQITLKKGDILVTLSDGVDDMKNESNIRYSKEIGVKNFIESYAKRDTPKTAQSLRKALEKEIMSYKGELPEVYADDISVFISSYVG